MRRGQIEAGDDFRQVVADPGQAVVDGAKEKAGLNLGFCGAVRSIVGSFRRRMMGRF